MPGVMPFKPFEMVSYIEKCFRTNSNERAFMQVDMGILCGSSAECLFSKGRNMYVANEMKFSVNFGTVSLELKQVLQIKEGILDL